MTGVEAVQPFEVRMPGAALADLRERLRRVRWPGSAPVGDWSDGVPAGWLRELVGFWADGYDWGACERRLNRWAQYRACGSTSSKYTSCTRARPTRQRCRCC